MLPALVALTARSFEGPARALAYGVLGGVSGAGIAVGPILGGWVTTNLTWRIVFVGEVLVVIAILLAVRLLPKDRGQPGAELDRVGAVLCALGLALVVFGVLEASTWGWLQPRNSPIEPFGFSLDAVRDRGRPGGDRRLPRVGAPPRASAGAAARALPPALDPGDAQRAERRSCSRT